MASTTSLTLPPSAFFTAFTASKSVSSVAKRRFGPTLPFKGVSLAVLNQPDASE